MPNALSLLLSRPVAALLAIFGLPEIAAEPMDERTLHTYERFTAERIDRGTGETVAPPGPVAGYLRWLGVHREVLFHGSRRGGLAELRTTRESHDASAFGDQQAVFATDDPVWALFFAVLERTDGFTSTRNATIATSAAPLRRRYFFSVNDGVPHGGDTGPGWLYVLPQAGFEYEPPRLGVLHTAQWVSRAPVRPLAAIAVAPADFPFADRIGRHRDGESILRTIWRARRLRT